MNDAERLRRLEDREAIRDLHSRYCFIQDRGHSSHAEEDIAAFLRVLWPRFESCMHTVHNLVVEFDSDDRARGRSSFEAVGDIDGVAFVAAGNYENEYVRTADGWKFLLHRECPFFFVEEKEGWAGPKPAIMKRWLEKRRL